MAPEKFACPFCMKFTKTKSNMEMHIRTHTGEQPFSCTHCEFACNRSSSLKRHMKSFHNL